MAMALAALVPPLSTWFVAVNRIVTEPYLDEVFHVRQAQQYCAGHYDVWDPKITTPPALYFLSTSFSQLSSAIKEQCGKLGFNFEFHLLGCDLSGLRSTNALGLVLLLFCIRSAYQKRNPEAYRSHPVSFETSALNVALFPLLFFFSSLYYTDVWSTVSVIVFNNALPNFFQFGPDGGISAWARSNLLLVLGIASLAFRQTNIFWVAVFPGAIVLVQQLDRGHEAVRSSMSREVDGFGDSLYSVAKTSWRMNVVYDVPVRDAWLDDYVKTIVSILACGLKTTTQPRHLFSMLSALAPYMTLVALFAAFVVWNGGVVLGDKSNHIATLHLSQMLYLWPFMVFFSWPLMYPYLLLLPTLLFAQLPDLGTLEPLQLFRRRPMFPRLWLTITILGLACVVVYTNTMIHPFTLADNRHYVFYVFKLLLRPWWVRYAVTPVYFFSAWATIQTFGGGPEKSALADRRTSEGLREQLPLPDAEHAASTSFVLIWIATSALQLITAPLVEPRYFILPWIFWRIHVPLQTPIRLSVQRERDPPTWSFATMWQGHDYRLLIETLWLLIVNTATGYVFLNWGFEWPQEPGKTQRFMW